MTLSEENNAKVGAFVTNRWLVSALLLLVMGMGGYIFKDIGKTGDAQAASVIALRNDLIAVERRVSTTESEVAVSKATQIAQYTEILRRFDGLERYIYRNNPPR